MKHLNVILAKSKLLLVIALSLFSNYGFSQFNETIRTGRPGQSIGPLSVGKYVFQTQTGFDFGGLNNDITSKKNFYQTPNTTIRFGIKKRVEINTAWAYSKYNFTVSDSNFSHSGLSFGSVGTRINLLKSKKNIPAVGMQVTFKLPILSADFNQKNLAPRIVFIASNALNDKFSYIANVGLSYNGDNSNPLGIYVLGLNYTVSEKFGVFVENYGQYSSGNLVSKWDGGFAYLHNDNLQFDVFGGISNQNGNKEYFVSLGVSWRTLVFRKMLLNK